MNNTSIAVLIGLVLIAGGGYFLLQGDTNETNDTQGMMSSDNMSEQMTSQESFSGSLQDLFTREENTRCTFDIDDEYTEGTGVVYVSDGRMRAEYMMTLKQDGSNVEGNTIIANDTMYAWGSYPQTGEFAMQTEFNEEDMNVTPTPEEAQQGVDLNDELDYNCASWNVDDSIFTPPSDIEFNNMQAQMEQMMQDSIDAGGLSCSSCDQIPDPQAKAQCQAALGCE